MTKEQAQKVLDELQGVRPEALNGEAKRLFEAIIKIADIKDKLFEENKELKNKINQLENMNEFQSKDIEKAVDYTFELNKEIEIKDQIIDLMSEMLNNHDIDEDICKQMGQKENCNEFTDKENCKNCIKQYFENKLKK